MKKVKKGTNDEVEEKIEVEMSKHARMKRRRRRRSVRWKGDGTWIQLSKGRSVNGQEW